MNRARLGVCGLFLANGAGFGAWAASVAGVKAGLGVSDGALGGALLCVAFGAIVAMPLAGWLGARHTPRLLTGTGVFLALVLPLPGLVPSLPVLSACLLLLGAAAGSMDVCMNARASRVEQDGGRAIMSSFHACFSLGGLIGTGLVALSVLVGAGVLGGLLLASLLVIGLVVVHWRFDARPDLAGREARAGLAWPGLAIVGIGGLCLLAFMCEGAVADWSGVFLRQVAGFLPPADVSGFAAFSAAMVAARLGGDAIVRRLGPARVLRLGSLLAASGVLLTMAIPSAGPVGFALIGLGGANMAPVLFSAAGRAGPAASAGVAAVATLGYGGMLLGPPLIGGLSELVGLRMAIGVLAAAMAAIALSAGLSVGRQRTAVRV